MNELPTMKVKNGTFQEKNVLINSENLLSFRNANENNQIPQLVNEKLVLKWSSNFVQNDLDSLLTKGMVYILVTFGFLWHNSGS